MIDLCLFLVDSQAHVLLQEVLLNKRTIGDIKKAGRNSTSELESFHAKLSHYAPKMTGYTYNGMQSRYYQLKRLFQNFPSNEAML